MEYSKKIWFKSVHLKIDYNKKDEIINVWAVVAGGGLILITSLMSPHFPELDKL